MLPELHWVRPRHAGRQLTGVSLLLVQSGYVRSHGHEKSPFWFMAKNIFKRLELCVFESVSCEIRLIQSMFLYSSYSEHVLIAAFAPVRFSPNACRRSG
jgi:hypothetical protein